MSDTAPAYSREDFVSAQWLAPQEILAQLNAGVTAKSGLRETIEFLLARGLV